VQQRRDSPTCGDGGALRAPAMELTLASRVQQWQRSSACSWSAAELMPLPTCGDDGALRAAGGRDDGEKKN
jgi:hypothetical protein